jgi:5-dehydro-2-deoxygluconokinase
VTIRSALRHVDIVIGTSEEIKASAHTGEGQANVTHSQVSNYQIQADQEKAIERILSAGAPILALKSGAEGSYIYQEGEKQSEHAEGFPVEVKNVLGAGDAFASGFAYGVINDWDLVKSARLGNACGAILVTEHGCANFMPTMDEVNTFVKDKGGL